MRDVEELVLRRLRRADLTVEKDGPADMLVSVMGGAPVPLLLKVRHRFSEQHLEEFQQHNRSSVHPVVLVTQALSPQRREQFRRLNLSWIEYETGVVHMRAPGLAVDLPEDPSLVAGDSAPPAMPGLAGKAGVIVEAVVELAQQRELVTQQEVVGLAGSTPAWTSKVFNALLAAGVLDVVGAGPRKRWRPDLDGLLDLWLKGRGPDPQTAGLYVHARSAEALLVKLAALDAGELPYAVGGVVAADLYEPTLTTRPVPAVWIPAAAPPEDLAGSLGGEVVAAGANLITWQASGDPALRLARPLGSWRGPPAGEADAIMLVSPGRACVEAATAPGRGPDAGESLRRALLQRAREAHARAD
ncbi:MAG: hypothetical protein HY704_05450 [Gemmatimonadetes bacterium]|nr:hypothetical protein [Gemmatimonadota bacterium]